MNSIFLNLLIVAYENHCGIDAREACCVCGGGLGPGDTEPFCAPETSPPTVDPNCVDFPTWVDIDGDDCSYYEFAGCFDANSYVDVCGVDANDACCTCGAGLRPGDPEPEECFDECQDYPTWADIDGDDCSFYESFGCDGAEFFTNECAIDAFSACCICSGGLGPDGLEPTC